uniref:Ribonuclease K6-like n=1 Tax=Phascolarctos cinereus TaxID=38626 RepID=A0A6P5LNE3_PHACI|nr:ribonuclease K6-like [Phascolarctos cinereus]
MQHWWFPKDSSSNPNVYCDKEMAERVNKHLDFCKYKNDFLHDEIQNIINVCQLPAITCKNGRDRNCHKSSTAIDMTKRILTWKNASYRFRGTVTKARFVVARSPPQPNDPQRDLLLPVHLD